MVTESINLSLRCHVQNAVYQLQVTKTNSDVQEQTSALKPVVICTHIVSRGGELILFHVLTNISTL